MYNSLGSEEWLNAPSSCHCHEQVCATLCTLFLPLHRMENACLQWTGTKDYSKMCYINIEDEGVFQKKSTASLLPLLATCVSHPHFAALFPLGEHTVTNASNQTLRRWRDTVPSKQREKESTPDHQETFCETTGGVLLTFIFKNICQATAF